MFGKLKKLILDVEAIWVYIEAHKSEIADLQKELKATQATIKKLAPPAPKKTK
jgi:HAMP domain-containing protein